jgi:hypothetical protein
MVYGRSISGEPSISSTAIYTGQVGVGIGPGALGAAFYILTVFVPPLLRDPPADLPAPAAALAPDQVTPGLSLEPLNRPG